MWLDVKTEKKRLRKKSRGWGGRERDFEIEKGGNTMVRKMKVMKRKFSHPLIFWMDITSERPTETFINFWPKNIFLFWPLFSPKTFLFSPRGVKPK
jgi:hypothetical protein